MAFTPIPIGSLAWGGPVNAAFTDQDARITAVNEMQTSAATDQNLIAWTWDPATNLQSATLTSGTPLMTKIWVREAATITNVITGVATVGVGLVAGQNFAGLYDSAGTRIGVTVDQTANWGTTGIKVMPLTVAVPVTPGAYYMTILSNAGTTPAFSRGSQAGSGPGTINVGLTAADARYATGPAAQTSLPLSITMAARTMSAIAAWAAFS